MQFFWISQNESRNNVKYIHVQRCNKKKEKNKLLI